MKNKCSKTKIHLTATFLFLRLLELLYQFFTAVVVMKQHETKRQPRQYLVNFERAGNEIFLNARERFQGLLRWETYKA